MAAAAQVDGHGDSPPAPADGDGDSPHVLVGRRPSFCILALAAGAGFAAAFVLMESRLLSPVMASSLETWLWPRGSRGTERDGGLARTSRAVPQYQAQGVRIVDRPRPHLRIVF